MDKLVSLSTETRSLDLSRCNLTSLLELMPRLGKLPRLHTLDLSQNQLTALPDDLSSLAHVKRLDITQNYLEDVGRAGSALRSMKELEVLSVDIRSDEERSLLLSTLPKLIQLNGKAVHHVEEISVCEVPSFPSEFLEKVAKLSEKVRKLRSGKESFREDRLKARLAELSADLEAKEGMPQQDPLQKRSITLTKRAFVTCFKDALKVFIDASALSLFQELESFEGELFDELSELVLTFAPPSPLRSPIKIEETDAVQMETEATPEQSRPKSSNAALENIGLKARIENLEMEVAQLNSQLQDKTASEGQLMRKMTSLLASQKSLELELKGYQDLLQRERVRTVEQEALLLENQEIKARLDSVMREKARDTKHSFDIRRTEDFTGMYRSVSHEKLRKSHAMSLRGSTVGDGKGMGLRHVLAMIADVYSAKTKSDARNRETHQPVDTLSEHLQHYLDTKYGLKVSVIQSIRDRCTLGLFSALSTFSKEDCDVELFSKLLRNQADERYRLCQDQLKARIIGFLRENRQGQKRKRWGELTNGDVGAFLTLSEAKAVIESLFPSDDWEVLQSVLKDYVQHFVLRRGDFPIARTATKDSRLPVTAFIHVLLKYRLQQHDDYMKPFLFSFQQADGDSDGRVTQSEFRTMLSNLSVQLNEDETLDLLRAVDPDNLQVMTLSQCADVFSEKRHIGKALLELFSV